MRIDIKGLRAIGFHGVRDFERCDGQEFVVDVAMTRHFPSADALPTTIDYSRIADTVVAIIEGPPVDLIETLARQIAIRLLHDRPSLRSVRVLVHKPNAPLKVPFDDVICQVKCRRTVMASEFVLSLGANLGDLDGNLRQAVNALSATPGIDLTACSSIYETTPVEITDEAQPNYHNLVVTGLTTLTAHELLHQTAAIEQRLGRTRPHPHAPRTIDIDIVAVDHSAINDDELTLPHPRSYQRAFVLIPWLEIAPRAELPQGRLAELIKPAEAKTVTKLSALW